MYPGRTVSKPVYVSSNASLTPADVAASSSMLVCEICINVHSSYVSLCKMHKSDLAFCQNYLELRKKNDVHHLKCNFSTHVCPVNFLVL